MLSIYPKPATGNITVSGAQGETVSIYTITGALIKQVQDISTVQNIDISELNSGLYIVRVGSITQKLVVE